MSFFDLNNDVQKLKMRSYDFINYYSVIIERGKSFEIPNKWALVQIALDDKAIACSNLRSSGEGNIIITNNKTGGYRFNIVGGEDERIFIDLKQRLAEKGYKIIDNKSDKVIFEIDPFTEHISNAHNAIPDNRPDPRIPLPKNIYR